MPIQACTSGGKPGFKWGEGGKCYTGPGAKEKARKQGAAIKINQGRYELLKPSLFDKFEERNIDDGVKVVFAKYAAFDRWGTQSVEFDNEKFDINTMVAWLESHDMLPIDVLLDDWDPEKEANPMVKAAMVDELVTALTWKPQTEENEGLRKKLGVLAQETTDSKVDFSKAIQILRGRVTLEILSPMNEGQEVWIDGLGRWVVTENLIYRPEGQIPHVLRVDSPVPPKDVSWLPSHVQYSLADEFRYWDKNTVSSRTETRNRLVDKLEELKLFG